VAIVLHSSVVCSLAGFFCDLEGRVICVDIDLGPSKFRFLSVYAPTEHASRKPFYENLSSFLSTSRSLFIAGDFNFVENIFLDKTGSLLWGDYGKEVFLDLKRDFDIADVYRVRYPEGRDYSYSNASMSSRLDRFYTSSSLLDDIHLVSYSPCSVSDHAYVDLTVDIVNGEGIGPGYWKLNTSILDNSLVVEAIEKLWREELAPMPVHDGGWWDLCKGKFRDTLISLSCTLARERGDKIRSLEQELRYFTFLEANAVVPGTFAVHIESIKSELSAFLQFKAEGAKIRAKVRYLECYEKPTRFFLKEERRRASKKLIDKLSVDGKSIDTLDGIKAECLSFYSNLLAEEPIDGPLAGHFLEGLPQLSAASAASCEGALSFDECLSALKAMSNHKTPGSDGLPKEFYIKFFYLFGHDFVDMVNLCYELDKMTPSQRECFISLLCKNWEKRVYLSFWRPISLLNVDYKIISKCMANRLKVVLSEIVHPDQTCSVPGRTIIDNCHLLRNIYDYVDSKNISCAWISLDQQKAFDRVSHSFMFLALRAFGFRDGFIRWVKFLYNDIFSKVIVNGHLTSPFQVTRGVRQGCPLSPLLYVLCIEPFGHRIRTDPHIVGLRLPCSDIEQRIVQYADDNTCIVTSVGSIRKIFVVAELYGLASGSRLNRAKCSGILLGGARDWSLPGDHCGISWVPFSRILGFRVGNCNILKENWDVVLPKVTTALEIHSPRRLSLRGKSVIINVCVLPKLWYLGKFLPISDDYISSVEKSIFSFIWDGKTEWIARKTLYLPLFSGGINLVNITLKLKAMYIIMHLVDFILGKNLGGGSFIAYWLGMELRTFREDIFSNLHPHSFSKPLF
jgi:hypothetical protein